MTSYNYKQIRTRASYLYKSLLWETGRHKTIFTMSKLAKCLVIGGMIFIFILVFAFLVGSRNSSGHSTPGVLGIILGFGLIAGIRAVWKSGNVTIEKKKDNNYDDDNLPRLNKN